MMNTRIEFLVPAERHKQIAENQRTFIRKLADKTERGEALNEGWEREWVAGILRAWVDQIPDAPPRRRGQAPKLDPGTLGLRFAVLIRQGMKRQPAYEKLAEELEVSVEAIKRALKKYGPQAERLIGRMAVKKKT